MIRSKSFVGFKAAFAEFGVVTYTRCEVHTRHQKADATRCEVRFMRHKKADAREIYATRLLFLASRSLLVRPKSLSMSDFSLRSVSLGACATFARRNRSSATDIQPAIFSAKVNGPVCCCHRTPVSICLRMSANVCEFAVGCLATTIADPAVLIFTVCAKD